MLYNMRRIYFVAAALAAFMMSCSGGRREVVEESAIPVCRAELTDVALDDSTMFPTDLVLLSDSILAVHERKNQTGFMTIYNTNSQQPVAAVGVIGEGPDDFVNPRLLHCLNTEKEFYIGDAKKIVRFSADSLSAEGYSGNKIMSLPSDAMFYNYILINNDSQLVYSQTGEHPISRFNKSTRELTFTDYWPEVDWAEGSDFIRNMEVFANCMTSAGNEIAIAYHNWNVISIIDSDGGRRAEIYLPEWDYNNGRMHIDTSAGNLVFDNDARIFFTKIKSDAGHIYALDWAATKEQIRNGEAGSSIYVLDWDGNIIRKIVFGRSVSNFCVKDGAIPYVTAIGDDGEVHVFGCRLTAE